MNKIKYIKEQVSGKSVLDLGCVAHNLKLIDYQGDIWMHQVIKNNSKNVIGLDYEKDMVNILSKKGYNMVYGDAEDFKFDRKFDIIFAGELIEHLSNLRGFFNSIKSVMNKESKLILTTPNCTRINTFTRILAKGKSIESNYHTLTFSAFLIKNILKFNGFKNIKVYYSNADYIANQNYIYRLLSIVRKEFRSNLVVECNKQ